MNQQSNNTPPPGLENIKRIVVLMFENRSFDHLFGDFPGVDGLFEGNGCYKENCYNLQDPLNPASANNPQYFPVPVDPNQPLQHDFTHDFGDGMMPDLFGPVFTIDGNLPLPSNPGAVYNSGYAKGQLVNAITPLPTTYPDKNSGFFTTYNSCMQQGQSAMTYFRRGVPRILHGLASEFVLCDQWHCDMPGHTLPNRAFIHCGTTGDAGIDDTDGSTVSANSIFDLINQQDDFGSGPTWKMYTPVDNYCNLGQVDTRFLNDNFTYYDGVPLSQFAEDCKKGTLPFYSFIMCWLPSISTDSYTDTSMHPYSMIQPGENLLAAVYNTLRNSPCWEDTLLVVNFDENGGIYDHVFPPNATPPNAKPPNVTPPYTGAPLSTQSIPGCCGNQWILNSTFDFSLLGPRIPALLISPWLSKGIDSTQYQNTSVLRFVIDTMNNNYGTGAKYLTQRDTNAPSLDSVFSQFGQSSQRTDCPQWIEPYSILPCTDPATCSNAIPYSDGTLKPWTPHPGIESAPPVIYINELLDIYTRPLPGHADTGKKVTRKFITNADVSQYMNERKQAAALYYQTQKK